MSAVSEPRRHIPSAVISQLSLVQATTRQNCTSHAEWRLGKVLIFGRARTVAWMSSVFDTVWTGHGVGITGFPAEAALEALDGARHRQPLVHMYINS